MGNRRWTWHRFEMMRSRADLLPHPKRYCPTVRYDWATPIANLIESNWNRDSSKIPSMESSMKLEQCRLDISLHVRQTIRQSKFDYPRWYNWKKRLPSLIQLKKTTTLVDTIEKNDYPRWYNWKKNDYPRWYNWKKTTTLVDTIEKNTSVAFTSIIFVFK